MIVATFWATLYMRISARLKCMYPIIVNYITKI